MNYGEIKKFDIANGPGVRVSLFVSGCRHHCKNCFNEATWDFSFGKPFTQDTVQDILKALSPDYIAGFSLLGGEPFEPENQPEIIKLLSEIRRRFPNKDIWCYTGFLFDKELMDGNSRAKTDNTQKMLENIDVLVDGRFIEEQKNISLKFRGSENQRIIDVKKSLETGTVRIYDI